MPAPASRRKAHSDTERGQSAWLEPERSPTPSASYGGVTMNVQDMKRAHPRAGSGISRSLVECIERCFSCAQSCTACADACLSEDKIDPLRRCIRLDFDCADICMTTGAVASRRTETSEQVLLQLLEVCANVCQICAEDCEEHASHHQHCKICAGECRRCEESCRRAMQNVGGASGRVQAN